VGAAFLVLAGISRWRGHDTAPLFLAAVGAALVAAGAVIPATLGPVHRGWMRVGLALSKVTTPLFMGLVYFVVLTPTALMMRILGKNPLRPRSAGGGFWVSRERAPAREESMKRQF
jgi:hypothetical protein